MVDVKPQYPFEPKSRAHLEPGQFWQIPLSNGGYGAGIVVAVPDQLESPDLPTGLKHFIAGVLDWNATTVPTAKDLESAPLVAWGAAHVKTVGVGDGRILGRVERPLEQISMLSHRLGGTVAVYVNGMRRTAASPVELKRLPVMGVWGFRYAQALAERRFVVGG